MISVIIPAHNEATVIDRLLAGLSAGVERGQLDVVVVANGCADDTAERARTYPGVKVTEIDKGHKPSAINEGERLVTGFPRFFLDADSLLVSDDLEYLAELCETEGYLAVAPQLHVDATSSSFLVRSYYRLWAELPSVSDGLSGRGCFGVSELGRTRWGEFPDLINDDRFVHTKFSPEERLIVEGVRSTVVAPKTARDLIARRVRTHLGNAQIDTTTAPATDKTGWIKAVRSNPRLLVDVPAYLALTMIAQASAMRSRGLGTEETWRAGSTTRSAS